MPKARTREEKLFGAAVVRRAFDLRGEGQEGAFREIYEGVLRDLGLTAEEVETYLESHASEVDAAIGRGKA